MKKVIVLFLMVTNQVFTQLFPTPADLSTGQGPIGTNDPVWQVSPWSSSIPANPVTGGILFSPAYIDNNCGPGAWVAPSNLPAPINNSNWITGGDSPCGTNINSGYRYFRLTLNLPAECNGFSVTDSGNYSISLSGYVDNQISDVFVNGVAYGVNGGSYGMGNQLDFILSGPWNVGINYIDVLVHNYQGGNPNPYGVLIVANNNNDNDNDGILDIDDLCPCDPGSGLDGCCPDLITSNDTIICKGDSVSLYVNDSGIGNTDSMFVWSDGQIGRTIMVAPGFTTNYSVTLNGLHGCEVMDSVLVTVEDNLQTSFTTNTAFCLNDSLLFMDNSVALTPDVITVYGWDFGDGSQALGDQVYHTYQTPGNYTVIHVVQTALGCLEAIIQDIDIYELPEASYTVIGDCENQPINFTNTSITNTPIVNWSWDFGDMNSGGAPNESHIYTTAGNFTTELIVVDDNGCSDTANASIIVNPTPQVAFNFMNDCLYDSIPFEDVSIIEQPGTLISWSWDVDGDNIEDYSTQTVNHLYANAGGYLVTLTVGATNGCSNSLDQLVNVFAVPQADFNVNTVCENGGPTQFNNTSFVDNGNIIGFGWDFGNGGFSTQENPSNYYAQGVYEATLGVISDNGCVDSVMFTVEVLGKPSAGFIQDTTQGCPIMCVTFSDTSYDSGGIVEWNWKFENDYGESNEQNPAYCYASSGDYDVGLIVTNVEGCKDTLENNGLITIHATPVSDFIVSPTSTDVQNATIDFTNNSIDVAAWRWDFGDESGNNYSDYNPIHLYSDSGHYEIELIVYNANLCADTSYQIVEILPVDDIFVPNAFSPNGDGINEVLYVRGFIKTMSFSVFDRLGRKVFESKEKDQGWDGTINGRKALEGVYTWCVKAEISGKTYKLKGDVTLIR